MTSDLHDQPRWSMSEVLRFLRFHDHDTWNKIENLDRLQVYKHEFEAFDNRNDPYCLFDSFRSN